MILVALILLAGTATATEPVPLVRTMADAATWEQRCRAEDDLANCSAPETLAALLLHGCLKMPDGPIWNGSDRETDHKLNAPVKWQIDTPPGSPEFFAATVRNAVSWSEHHRGESPEPNR